MICPNCKATIEEGSNICKACGMKIEQTGYQYKSRDEEVVGIQVQETYEGDSIFTVRNILKVLSVICAIFFFCPTFMVSCSGQSVNVSAMSTVGEMTVFGEKVADAHPYMLILLALPIIILVILFMDLMDDLKAAILMMLCTGSDFAIWIAFRYFVKKAAEENYCTYQSTAWFTLNMIVLAVIFIIDVLIAMEKIYLESDLLVVIEKTGMTKAVKRTASSGQRKIAQMGKSAGNAAGAAGDRKTAVKGKVIGYCSKCGSPLVEGNRFCSACGKAVPEELLKE